MSQTLQSYSLIVFDLDGTLAPSKTPLEPETAELLSKLILKSKVAIISGGGYAQFETQLLKSLPVASEGFTNLLLLPASGTRLYTWRGGWCEQYAEHLTPKEKEEIMAALNVALKTLEMVDVDRLYGPQIEDRGSQITYSGLGQSAPILMKSVWDPHQEKRKKIVEILSKKIPRFDSRIGGMTSVDITRRGVNKAYGIRKLEEYLKIGPDQILFVGDALFLGGNDYPVMATGVDCIPVKGPEETRALIREWLA